MSCATPVLSSGPFGHVPETAGHVAEIAGHDPETAGHLRPKYAHDTVSRLKPVPRGLKNQHVKIVHVKILLQQLLR